MKRLFMTFALLGVIFSTNLWAHHMAEGIISAELWDQIDDAIADTPHNEMLDSSGSTMLIEEDEDSGVVYLVTDVPYVYDEDSEDFDSAEDALEDLMDAYVVPETDEMNRMPTGTVISEEDDIDSRTTYVTYSVVYDDDGEFVSATITTYEPIGNMRRTEEGVEDPVATTVPGKRAGG